MLFRKKKVVAPVTIELHPRGYGFNVKQGDLLHGTPATRVEAVALREEVLTRQATYTKEN